MTEQLAKKVFPAYFENFTLPETAQEQEIEVYRACRTRKIERESFLNTYEENSFKVPPDKTEDDPQVYCLSTYRKLRDVKRFVIADSKYQPPWALAKGHTTKVDGLSCETKSWKKKFRSSHVDWWLYEGAEPWLAFEVTTYEKETEA
ncbi:MAG: hypothetical protein IJR72_05445 [Oscillospiraceae bacterium]|nr:hypothetical protein [Oscillospiraceae bacterium]